ncbi:MAG: EAL domain-containing protein, partial [Comamonas sp.]|nr:EAL domain-containing protein [Comamonas sp.]
QSADDMAISHAVIAMGQSMGMEVLAEGVETAAQLEFLRQHGCNFYQGYFCSKPMAATDFEKLLRGEAQRLMLQPQGAEIFEI